MFPLLLILHFSNEEISFPFQETNFPLVSSQVKENIKCEIHYVDQLSQHHVVGSSQSKSGLQGFFGRSLDQTLTTGQGNQSLRTS